MDLKEELEFISNLRKEYRKNHHSMDIHEVLVELSKKYYAPDVREYPVDARWDIIDECWVMVVAWSHAPVVARCESITNLVLLVLSSMERKLNELSTK